MPIPKDGLESVTPVTQVASADAIKRPDVGASVELGKLDVYVTADGHMITREATVFEQDWGTKADMELAVKKRTEAIANGEVQLSRMRAELAMLTEHLTLFPV